MNTELYSPSLRSYSQHNDSEVTKSGLQMRADQLTSRLEEVKRVELENELADDDNKSGKCCKIGHFSATELLTAHWFR